jgi:hypothetical protein
MKAEVRFAPRRPAPAGRHASCPARTFTMVEFDRKTLEHRLRELAFLNSGVKHRLLEDERHAEPWEIELQYEGGVEEFVKHIDRQDAADGPSRSTWWRKDGIGVEVAMWWNDSYHENVLCFTNNIPQRDGGTHLAGFRGALTRVINKYAQETRHREEGEGRHHRRRRPRRPDLRAVGQGAGPEILVADQGQAGLLRGAPGRRNPGQRGALASGSRRTRPKPSSSARSSRPPPPAKPPARRAN